MEKYKVEFYHRKSLILGKMFADAYEKYGGNHRLTQLLLEKYKAARREIPKDDSYRVSARYHAYEAYLATQGY